MFLSSSPVHLNTPYSSPKRHQPKLDSIKQPNHTTTPLTETEVSALQVTADALLNQIHNLRTSPNDPILNPNATPFTPTPTQDEVNDIVWGTATPHKEPELDPLPCNHTCLTQTKEPNQAKPRLRWSAELTNTHYYEPEERVFNPLTTAEANTHFHQRQIEKRSRKTNRSKRHRDQVIDIAVTLHLIHAKTTTPSPNVPHQEICSRNYLKQPHFTKPYTATYFIMPQISPFCNARRATVNPRSRISKNQKRSPQTNPNTNHCRNGSWNTRKPEHGSLDMEVVTSLITTHLERRVKAFQWSYISSFNQSPVCKATLKLTSAIIS